MQHILLCTKQHILVLCVAQYLLTYYYATHSGVPLQNAVMQSNFGIIWDLAQVPIGRCTFFSGALLEHNVCEDESQALPTLRLSTYALFEACRPLRKRWSLLKNASSPPGELGPLEKCRPQCVFTCLNYLKIFHGDVFIVGESVGLLLKNASAPPRRVGTT